MRLLFFISLLMLFGCQSTKTIPADYEGKRITFGTGGGFTGAVTTYCLLENGRLYMKAGMPGKDESPFEQIKRINKNDRTALFSQTAEAVSLIEIDREPGNMYSFLEWELEESKGRYTWDAGNPPAEDPIIGAFNSLMEITK